MKRNILSKMLVVGFVFLFLGMIMQPVTSIDISQEIEKESNDISDDSKLKEDCNCPDVASSGKPICDKIQQLMESNKEKLNESGELLEKYKNYPIRGRLVLYYVLILLTIDVYLLSAWFLLGCNN